MSADALFADNHGIAYSVARHYRVPGADREDVQQEALLGLWIAASAYRGDRGATFSTFAHTVIHRRLCSMVKAGLAKKQQVLTGSVRDDGYVEIGGGVEPERVVIARDTIDRIVSASKSLSEFERHSLARMLNDERIACKREDGGRQRAKRKLKAAA